MHSSHRHSLPSFCAAAAFGQTARMKNSSWSTRCLDSEYSGIILQMNCTWLWVDCTWLWVLFLPFVSPIFFFCSECRSSSWHGRSTGLELLEFFFELCCARHYNCGSHWAALVLSLLDNGIKRKGQGQWKTKQTTPPNNNQNTPPVPDQSSKRWNKVRQAQALAANYSPRLSQRLQQEIVKGQCSV